MQNFDYRTPTRLIFGKGSVEKLPDASLPEFEIAEKAIQATHEFFASIGIPMTLRAVGIDESRIEEMAQHVTENDALANAWVPLAQADVAAIFRSSLD